MRAMASFLVAAQQPGSEQRMAAEREGRYAWRCGGGGDGGGDGSGGRELHTAGGDAEGAGGSRAGGEGREVVWGRWERLEGAAEGVAAVQRAAAAAVRGGQGERLLAAV
jgi:hypothetical protein